MDSSSTLRVLIVAGDPLARAGLAAILAEAPELTIVGQMEPSATLLSAATVFRPDVVLWDIGWASHDDILILAAALDETTSASDPALPIVVLLADEDAAPSVWQTGVHGILARRAPASAVSAGLMAAAHGLIVVQPRLAAVLAGPQNASAQASIDPLTPREQEVLGWMAQGYPNKAIARELGITEHTVKFHVNAVLAKLGAQSRTEAVVVASRAGLVLL